MSEYDKLTEVEKWAVDWHAEQVLKSAVAKGNVFAQNSREAFIKATKENTASAGSVAEVVAAWKTWLRPVPVNTPGSPERAISAFVPTLR